MDESYDFIVAGAGSAGAVLANRLSADPTLRVCLIEAGPRDRSPLIHVPIGLIGLAGHRRLNWNFTGRADAAGRAVDVPRGRTLGGSSAVNGMVYTRGHPRDYDDWAAAGNTGWSYADLLPYFKRSENNERFPDSPFHGRGGPLNVTDLKRRNPLADVLIAAAGSLQIPYRDDFNAEDQEGFGYRQVTQRNGRRESSATAYLDPVRGRPNLTIVTDGAVRRVVIADGRATGVEIDTAGGRRIVSARREVVLSAGAIGSPVLLMRSGIGDGRMLAAHGIAVLRDAPAVGGNLQDHIAVPVKHMSPSWRPYGISLRTLPYLAWSAAEYVLFRRGLVASNIMEAGGFVRSRPDLDRPDLQFVFMPGHRMPGRKLALGHGYALYPVVLRPASRGRVGLSDDPHGKGPLGKDPLGKDPLGKPAIDFNLFQDAEADRDLLVRGLGLARRILAAPAFDPYRGPEVRPGPEVHSAAELASYVGTAAQTIFHPVGTCRMGPDADAVVDPHLRVRGIDGLRVADASIMPTIIGGNTSAPAMMIGEKAADMMLGRPALAAERV